MKKSILLFLISLSFGQLIAQTEDYYGPVTISFHGIICNRPTNDDPLGMDGVGDEVSVHFWDWIDGANNRASYNGLLKIYGENFLLPDRIKAGTATINGGLKAGDSYYRESVYGDENPLSLSTYAIVTTFCSQNTIISIIPTIFERDKGDLGVTPIQDFGVRSRQAFSDDDIHLKIWDFSKNYVYNDNDPYAFVLPGRYIGLDAKYAGLFTANKNKLASRPIGLFSNWDFSSQLIALTPKTIKIISEKDFGYGKGILPIMFNEETMGNTEGHGNYILLLRFVSDIKDRNAGNPPPNVRTVSMKVSNVIPGEEYKFRLWTVAGLDTISIKYPDTTMIFPRTMAPGQFYNVVQTAGPRTCQLINDRGSVGPSNIVVTANCAELPTTHKIGVKVNAVGEEERFEFSAGATRKIIVTEGNKIVYFPGTFKTGDNYTISQLSGPRDCQLTSVTGQVEHADIIIDANCGPVPVKVRLRGKLTAPKGTTITLKLNNAEILKIVQTENAPGGSGTTPFTFISPYYAGSSYTVTLQSPNSANAVIYENAEGRLEEDLVVGVRSDKGIDLVSRSTDNKTVTTYYESFNPVISGKGEDEGRYVAFGSSGKGMDGSSGKFRQIFWRDRKLGITKLISRTSTGEEGNANSQLPAISADGLSVAFESYATNLAAADNNGVNDVFVWKDGIVTLVSNANGATANGESSQPTISGDGSVVAYTSYASNIVPLGTVYSTPNVYVYQQSSTDFITKDYETGKAVTGYSPSISEDGRSVAFCAYNNRLVENDNNNLWDIFLWTAGSPTLKRISMTSTGGERNQGTESSSRVVAPSISGDGQWIVYATTASNMVPGDDNGMQDIFICNSSGGNVSRVSSVDAISGNGDSPISQGEKIGISYDGNWITYNTNADNLGARKGNIVLQNTRSGKLFPITAVTNSSTDRPLLSRSGGYVIAGCSEKYDTRFPSSGIFVFYTGQ